MSSMIDLHCPAPSGENPRLWGHVRPVILHGSLQTLGVKTLRNHPSLRLFKAFLAHQAMAMLYVTQGVTETWGRYERARVWGLRQDIGNSRASWMVRCRIITELFWCSVAQILVTSHIHVFVGVPTLHAATPNTVNIKHVNSNEIPFRGSQISPKNGIWYGKSMRKH